MKTLRIKEIKISIMQTTNKNVVLGVKIIYDNDFEQNMGNFNLVKNDDVFIAIHRKDKKNNKQTK